MPADTHEEKPGHICWFTRSGQNMKHLISHAHVRLYIRTLLLYVLTTEHHRLTVGRKVGQNVQQNARAHTHTHTSRCILNLYRQGIYKYPCDIISQFVFDLGVFLHPVAPKPASFSSCFLATSRVV